LRQRSSRDGIDRPRPDGWQGRPGQVPDDARRVQELSGGQADSATKPAGGAGETNHEVDRDAISASSPPIQSGGSPSSGCQGERGGLARAGKTAGATSQSTAGTRSDGSSEAGAAGTGESTGGEGGRYQPPDRRSAYCQAGQ